MDIMNMLGNNIITGGITFLGGMAFWWVANELYRKAQIQSIINGNARLIGNKLGLYINKNILIKIPNEELRNQFKESLKSSGDKFDDGLDDGLDGIEI